MIAGLAAAEAIEEVTKSPVFLKWPNDVVIKQDDGWAKVCGILLEGSITPENRLMYAILGMGINVNIRASDLPHASQPVTSLMIVDGKPLGRLPLLTTLLRRLESWYEAAEHNRSPHTAWNRRLITLGQLVEVKRMGEDSSLVGTAEGTDELGQLLVRDDKGQLHVVMAADVTLQKAT
jgi:BirA family biotin operon repressor/biotin-[acetyl-CoA-carboxylase] ligase